MDVCLPVYLRADHKGQNGFSPDTLRFVYRCACGDNHLLISSLPRGFFFPSRNPLENETTISPSTHVHGPTDLTSRHHRACFIPSPYSTSHPTTNEASTAGTIHNTTQHNITPTHRFFTLHLASMVFNSNFPFPSIRKKIQSRRDFVIGVIRGCFPPSYYVSKEHSLASHYFPIKLPFVSRDDRACLISKKMVVRKRDGVGHACS